MWYQETTFYQIYPFGFFGAPKQNDGILVPRIQKTLDWIEHLKKLNVGAVYFSPIFESDSHGYDTRDFQKVDCRLGSNEDFASVSSALHSAGIRVVLDGVFHHVGRGFWAFQDLLRSRESSPYRDWFYVDFSNNSPYNDGFFYEGWEGHYELVKLNLRNDAVVEHLLDCIRFWFNTFSIDGLRLDVSYLLDEAFLRRLHTFVKTLSPDFFLLGEIIHGDYNRILNPEMLDSCTNYEAYKGIHSSLNDQNLFEIAYSLNRQFGPEQWTLYKGKPLYNFIDNHDVNRIASELKNPAHLNAAYGLLFGMPGIPSIYYGSEWGVEGIRSKTDDSALRPCFSSPVENELFDKISRYSKIRRDSPALCYGSYRQLYVSNQAFAFLREWEQQRVVVAVNAGSETVDIPIPSIGKSRNLLTGEPAPSESTLTLSPFETAFYLCD